MAFLNVMSPILIAVIKDNHQIWLPNSECIGHPIFLILEEGQEAEGKTSPCD